MPQWSAIIYPVTVADDNTVKVRQSLIRNNLPCVASATLCLRAYMAVSAFSSWVGRCHQKSTKPSIATHVIVMLCEFPGQGTSEVQMPAGHTSESPCC
jgi:hypothetical protein